MTNHILAKVWMLSCLFRTVPAFLFPNTRTTTTSNRQMVVTTDSDNEKRIVFIRHGCTYMNEYLDEFSYGSPNFTDIFPSDVRTMYLDTTLSPRGQQQAMTLSKRLHSKNHPIASVIQDIDVVLVSPLTRALQTFEIGLKQHIPNHVPIMALPLASERCWLISDIGRPRAQLFQEYPFCDFETEFLHCSSTDASSLVDEWWFGLDDCRTDGLCAIPSGNTRATYKEWRPTNQGQTYAFPGEPDAHFESRMIQLYQYLQNRPESTIAVICHWGVIQWMLGVDFENCEARVVQFADIAPKIRVLQDEL